MNLLHIVASPRAEHSASTHVAKAFVDGWREKHGAHASVETLDIWQLDLPAFDGAALEAKYAGIRGEARSTEQEAAWARMTQLAGHFLQADTILFSVPMWNFGIPYKLKHLIDAVSHKDLLFSFDERGLVGLLGGKKVVAVESRGVALGPDYPASDFDFQGAYLKTWARMVGIVDFHSVTVEKTLAGRDSDLAARAAGCAAARALAVAA